jgi:hypothetical protein
MSHDIVGQLTARFGEELCRTRVTEAVGIAESPALGNRGGGGGLALYLPYRWFRAYDGRGLPAFRTGQ